MPETIRYEGMAAHRYGTPERDNPYVPGTPEADEWQTGWNDARREEEHRHGADEQR